VNNIETGNNNANKTDQYGYRAMLDWQPLTRLKVSTMYILQGTHLATLPNTDNPNGKLQTDNQPRLSPTDTRYDIAKLGFDFHTDWGDFVSQTGRTSKRYHSYVDESRAVVGSVPILARLDDNHSQGLTQELRFSSPEDPQRRLNFVLGVFGQRVKQDDCNDLLVTPGIPILPVLPSAVSAAVCPGNQAQAGNEINTTHFEDIATASELALFGESSLKFFNKRLELSLGARLYHTNVEGGYTTAGLAYAANNGTTSPTFNGENNIKNDGVNPKFAASYHFSKDFLTYASASRGFRFGGFNPPGGLLTPVPSATFKSDSLWSYETGLRTQWFNRSLTADIALYKLIWKSPQLYQAADNGLVQYISNVGGAKSNGVETSLRYRVPFLPGLSIAVAAAYADTVTTEAFTTSMGTATTPGTDWPLSPKWQTSTILGYEFALGPWSINPTMTHTYSSHAYNNLDHQARIYGYQTLDTGLSLGNLRWDWFPELVLTVNNLTDTRALSGAYVYSSFSDNIYIPPRSINLRIQGRI
jgi:outer membrane receptor protein involved in Fe transport